MARSDDKQEGTRPEGNGLESYRRLIELQKQMIQLSQQHDQARRELDARREVVADEVAKQARSRNSVGRRLCASALKLLKSAPGSIARQIFS